jgi:tetratricopeptide (TPR) repeat protein
LKVAQKKAVVSQVFTKKPVAAYVRLEPFFQEAETDVKNGRFGSAIRLYRRILESVNPDDFTSMRGLAVCLLENKSHKYGEIIGLLQRVCRDQGIEREKNKGRILTEKEKDWEAENWLLLARACVLGRQWDLALSALRSAFKAAPTALVKRGLECFVSFFE